MMKGGNKFEQGPKNDPPREYTDEEVEAMGREEKLEYLKMKRSVLETSIRLKWEDLNEQERKIEDELIPAVKESYIEAHNKSRELVEKDWKELERLEKAIYSLEEGEKDLPDNQISNN